MKIVEASTPDELQRYYDLRWKILRAPWKQPRGSERDELEQSSHHLMVVDDQQVVIGVGRLHFNNIREAQIRYMAVAIKQQRKGIGTLLVNVLEQRAVELGAARIVLDARESALGFYRKQGYEVAAPGHVLYKTITHINMTKSLHM